MKRKYSLVIYPSEDVISLVKSMKLQLDREVGWFHSKNSVGHITICVFEATDEEIEMIKNQLSVLCDTLQPVEIRLNDFGSYPNGAFFISPDENSKSSLKPIMKRFNESLHIPDMKKSDDPHLSIARGLTPEKLERAKSLFTKVDVNFLCKSVVLRKFDEHIKQYFVTDEFEFKSNSEPEPVQGTLF